MKVFTHPNNYEKLKKESECCRLITNPYKDAVFHNGCEVITDPYMPEFLTNEIWRIKKQYRSRFFEWLPNDESENPPQWMIDIGLVEKIVYETKTPAFYYVDDSSSAIFKLDHVEIIRHKKAWQKRIENIVMDQKYNHWWEKPKTRKTTFAPY